MKTIPAVLHVPELADEPALIHGFSTTLLGSVGLTHATDRAAVMKSRDEFARILELDGSESLTVAGAIHGADVARVDSSPAIIDDVDALITDRRGIGLFTTHADCLPIVLWDPIHGAVGLAHAGWRGTRAGVAVAALSAMEREFGTKPRDVRAGIGPGICGRCYEVGPEVAENFEDAFLARQKAFTLHAAIDFGDFHGRYGAGSTRPTSAKPLSRSEHESHSPQAAPEPSGS